MSLELVYTLIPVAILGAICGIGGLFYSDHCPIKGYRWALVETIISRSVLAIIIYLLITGYSPTFSENLKLGIIGIVNFFGINKTIEWYETYIKKSKNIRNKKI